MGLIGLIGPVGLIGHISLIGLIGLIGRFALSPFPFSLLKPFPPPYNLLEEFHLLSFEFAQQLVCKTAGAQTEPLVSEPLLAQHLFYDGVIGDGIHHAVDAASGLETNLYAWLVVIFFDSLAHHVGSLGRGRDLLFASRGLDIVGTSVHRENRGLLDV